MIDYATASIQELLDEYVRAVATHRAAKSRIKYGKGSTVAHAQEIIERDELRMHSIVTELEARCNA